MRDGNATKKLNCRKEKCFGMCADFINAIGGPVEDRKRDLFQFP